MQDLNKLPSLKSLPEQLVDIEPMCSNSTIKPASLAESRSGGPLALLGGMKISRNRGIIFSVKGRLPEGRSSIILKTFCRISDISSRSFISSSSAGKTFLSSTAFGKDESTLGSPRMNWAFSFGVLAGNESKNLIVDIRILSK